MPTLSYELTEIDPTNCYIKLARGDGQNTITFSDMRLPAVLPDFTYQGRRQKVSIMRPSATTPGYRVVQSYGSHDNYMEFTCEFPLVMASEVDLMRGWFNNRPGTVLLSIDGGATRYICLWKENGLAITNYMFNQRKFSKVKVDLMVLTATTSVSFS